MPPTSESKARASSSNTLPQGSTDHIHTIVREFGNDYGKKLIK